MRIEAKKVELFELFYDLVFVYAISRVTLLLEEPVSGVFTFEQFFVYIISTLAVLQSWMYMTNYINRYGQWRWYEYVFLSILANSVYYHKGIPFHATDILISLMFVALGAAIAFLYMDSPYGFLMGALTAASGNFLLLMHKFHRFKGTLPSEDGAEGTG